MPEAQDLLHEGQRPSNFVTDMSSGSYVSNHELVLKNPDTLLFDLYYDDYEISNPIGSHRKKHKQGLFYWQLLNIPPEYRSRLSSIQLLACAKSLDIKKFGLKHLSSDFIISLQKLYSGTELTVNGTTRKYHGLLVGVLGDTLAAQMLGGFKEGVGTAYKPSRNCEVTCNELSLSRTAKDFAQRDEQEHRDRCNMLTTLGKKSRKYWSRHYGITQTSIFMSVPGFSITKCLLQDPLHVLLEGVNKICVKLLLNNLIFVNQFFTLEDINAAITNFCYSYSDALDKPRTIERNDLLSDGVMVQSAASMRVLTTLLPFLIGQFVPQNNEYWMNFIRLQQINMLCFSPIVSVKTIATLRALYASHNKAFVQEHVLNDCEQMFKSAAYIKFNMKFRDTK
jgi:hypothetical protein